MRKKILCVALLLLALGISASGAENKTVEIGSGAAVLMDASSGQVLYDKNMRAREYPASITKILTAVLALEKGKPDDKITLSAEAVYGVPAGSSNIALQPGEELTLEQALYAMLLMSANDAANGIAEYAGGSLEGFAELMNERAAQLGADGSHFVNANGLPDDGHYTTAYDMAVFMRRALELPDFVRISGTVTYTMPPTNLQPEARNFANQHKMMKNTSYAYEGVFAGKTGYTSQAGHTLVTAAKRDGRTLICVVLAGSDAGMPYEDTKTLLDYGFGSLESRTIKKEEVNRFLAGLFPEEEERPEVKAGLTALVPSGTDPESLTFRLDKEEDSVLAEINDPGMGGAAELGSLPLVYPAAPAAARQAPSSAAPDSSKDPRASVLTFFFIAAGVLLCLGTLLFLWGHACSRRRKARRNGKIRGCRR